MKSTGLKGVFLGLTCFAMTTAFAQDTTNKPKPDTTMPKRDTTSMNITGKKVKADQNITLLNNAENFIIAKSEMENEVSAKKSAINLVS